MSGKIIKVNFKTPAGKIIEVEATNGLSLMNVATSLAVPGIDAECGGSLSCATCHVHVDTEWFNKLPPASKSECDLLEFAADPHPRGRLSCQIKITEALDGLFVVLPENQ